VENAGLENAGPSYGGGKRETSCYGTPKQQKDKTFIAQFGAKYETYRGPQNAVEIGEGLRFRRTPRNSRRQWI